MREELDGPLGDSVGRAGALIENALSRAVRTGKLGFEDLRQAAARAMAEIARSAVSGGIGNLSGGSTGGDLVSGLGSIVTALGLAGRAPWIGRGAWMERGCQYACISVAAVSLITKNTS